MKEKELRLALVVYGGVSLAVYMHGVTKEILKLVRASRDRQVTRDNYLKLKRADFRDSEDIYTDLLNVFEPDLDLRVLVDVIAGASAGGINGVILARALAHDLEFDPVRSFWLKEMDVTELINEQVKAGRWSKIFFRPAVWAVFRWYHKILGGDPEFKRKLSIFLRSRWFKPPFDGTKLTRVLFDGIASMGDPLQRGRSLLPTGLPLDLFVTVTDFFGFSKETPIHDPPTVVEREHRQIMKFFYRQWPAGTETSDFDRDNIPALAFASRATSSFPGAFPPALLGECDQLIQSKGLVWKNRVDFLYDNFRPYLTASMNPADIAFLDGSVLVNKPFAQAIHAIGGRPAYRQVDRRLLYIDPNPRTPKNQVGEDIPGFFQTLKGALSDIPRNEPIHEDLAWVNAYNTEVSRLQAVINTSRSHIEAIVEDVAGAALSEPLDGHTIGRLRIAANGRAREKTGFAYDGYLRLKLAAVIDDIIELLVTVCGHSHESAQRVAIQRAVKLWAGANSVDPASVTLSRPETGDEGPPWVRFLLTFDARYRQRRLRFTIRTINDLYARAAETGLEPLSTSELDTLKTGLYETLDVMSLLDNASTSFPTGPRDEIKALAKEATCILTEAGPSPGTTNEKLVSIMQTVMDKLGDALDLENHAGRTEETLAKLTRHFPPNVRRHILETYIGFAAWDVLTFSVTRWRDLDEFDEIRIDRLSPDDAQTLRHGGAKACLKGLQFNHFGAFFSRAYRENDYLWGRLHAAERLIDIVVDAARLEGLASDLDINHFKRRAFLSILESEKSHLPSCHTLIAELRYAASVM